VGEARLGERGEGEEEQQGSRMGGHNIE
jgi:hypothetical protein